MNRYKHIIRETIIVFFILWVALSIASFILYGINQEMLDFMGKQLLLSCAVVIGCVGVGISLSAALIAFVKRVKLGKIFKTDTNGRYSISMGSIPRINKIKSSRIVDVKDLPEEIIRWKSKKIITDKVYVDLFLKSVSILKYYSELPSMDDSSRNIYSYNIGLASKLLQLAKDKSAPTTIIKEMKNVTKDDVYQLLTSPLMAILTIAHNLGDAEILRQNSKGVWYRAGDVGLASRTIIARYREFWALSDNDKENLLLALGSFNNPSNMPKDKVNGDLIVRSQTAYNMVMLLNYIKNISVKYHSIKPLTTAEIERPENVVIRERQQQELIPSIDGGLVEDSLVENSAVSDDSNSLKRRIRKKNNKIQSPTQSLFFETVDPNDESTVH